MESRWFLNLTVDCAALCRGCAGRRIVISRIYFSKAHRWARSTASPADHGKYFLLTHLNNPGMTGDVKDLASINIGNGVN
jgi:hypothetical protein